MHFKRVVPKYFMAFEIIITVFLFKILFILSQYPQIILFFFILTVFPMTLLNALIISSWNIWYIDV